MRIVWSRDVPVYWAPNTTSDPGVSGIMTCDLDRLSAACAQPNGSRFQKKVPHESSLVQRQR